MACAKGEEAVGRPVFLRVQLGVEEGDKSRTCARHNYQGRECRRASPGNQITKLAHEESARGWPQDGAAHR